MAIENIQVLIYKILQLFSFLDFNGHANVFCTSIWSVQMLILIFWYLSGRQIKESWQKVSTTRSLDAKCQQPGFEPWPNIPRRSELKKTQALSEWKTFLCKCHIHQCTSESFRAVKFFTCTQPMRFFSKFKLQTLYQWIVTAFLIAQSEQHPKLNYLYLKLKIVIKWCMNRSYSSALISFPRDWIIELEM